MRTAVFSAKPFEVNALRKANADGAHDLIYIEDRLNLSTLEKAEGFEAVSVFSNDDLSARVLDGLLAMGIRHVTLRSAGYDHVDLGHAQCIGITVANVPEYSPYSIAEHSVMMMLALNRRVLMADRRLRTFDFTLDPLVGFDMNGKTAGIIGTGKIGAVVARILHGLGCRLLGFDIEPDPALTEHFGMEYVPLGEMYPQCDIITIHCPLVEATHYMIDVEAIARMKQGVMLINTARGGIIRTADLFPALDSGQIGYLGLDVYEHEKGVFFFDHSQQPPEDEMLHRLLTYDNVLITGHQAFLTETALRNIAETTLENLRHFARGEAGPNALS
jgi:D-lactate dehydrogenase